MRILLAIILALALAAGVLFIAAGRAAAPAVQINQPSRLVGMDAALDVTVEAPAGTLTGLDITLEQKDKRIPLFSLSSPAAATVKQESPERMRITRPMGKRALPELQAGAGRVVVTATRKTLFGIRTREGAASKEFQARFTPPRVGAVSTHHFVNLGGSEFVVYRVDPPDAESGVQVGETRYPGYPATGAGTTGNEPGLRAAFFALLHDQDVSTPIRLYARDEAGNVGHGSFEYRVFPKAFTKGRIELNDAFLRRVVPEILERAPELNVSVDSPESYLPAYLKINRDLRQANADKIVAISAQTSPQMVWHGPFRPLGNASIESKFADRRTYFYGGKEVDQQVHLGFDLAVTVNIPVLAANEGKVLFADFLGIYGNCVIVDHGMGIGSLYAHLSSMDVKAGDTVAREQRLGRSGMTGLAGGDHLHFSMLLQGRPVNSVEWWDPHWIEDRVLRKVREASHQ
jgi:murein DD-endopeptidase MepM/ murein hydrolase activator NlpD